MQSEHHNLREILFKNGELQVSPPIKIPQLLTNFYKVMVGTGTSSTVGKIEFLRTLLQGKALREYNLIFATFGGTMATHLHEIRKGLLKYFLPRNALSKQKRDMICTMRKPRGVKLRQFVARLQE